ncbi:MAG: DUF819 family protein [Bacteroidales bacterium]|nr:DUF819 family protein [Bacteroidales bacterium]
MIQALFLIFYLLFPALVVYGCKRSKALNKVGEILLLYGVGILIANLFIFPLGLNEAISSLQDTLTSVTILLAIPMILFGCDFRHWPLKSAVAALIIGVVSVLATDIGGYFIFNQRNGDMKDVASLLVGVYTGGTPNLASIKMALGIDETTYFLVNTFDMLISFVYLVFLMSVGIKLFRKLLSKKKLQNESVENVELNSISDAAHTYEGIFTRQHFGKTMAAFGLSLLIVGVSMGISFLIVHKIDNMLILILSLTTFSILTSFIPGVRKMEKSYDAGMYLVLVFSLVVASMVDVTAIDYRASLSIIAYIAFVIFGSLFLSVLLAKIFKIDSDTMVISSVALINSPLFVPMIAESMKNRKVIITGITVGVVGYAIGNYLGILVHGILP